MSQSVIHPFSSMIGTLLVLTTALAVGMSVALVFSRNWLNRGPALQTVRWVRNVFWVVLFVIVALAWLRS